MTMTISELRKQYDALVPSVLMARGERRKELVAEAKALQKKIDRLKAKQEARK